MLKQDNRILQKFCWMPETKFGLCELLTASGNLSLNMCDALEIANGTFRKDCRCCKQLRKVKYTLQFMH